MAIKKITFNNKVNFSENIFTTEDENKIITAENVNELKTSINSNADELTTIKQELNTFKNDMNNKIRQAIRALSTTHRFERVLTTSVSIPNIDNSSVSISYPSAPTLNPGEFIECYIVSVRLHSEGNYNSYNTARTVRFNLESRTFGDQQEGFSDDLEVQNQSVDIKKDGYWYDASVLFYPEGSSFNLKHATFSYYNGTFYSNSISADVQVTAKIGKLIPYFVGA